MSQAVKHYPMPVVPAELVEPLIRFLSDREERIEFPPHMFSMLKALGEEIALAALTAKPLAATEKHEISNMHATGLYLRAWPLCRRLNQQEGYTVNLYTAPPALVSTGQ
ncbi:hypothetical protein QM543_10020 [Pantoea eucrina]|uniref:hypothetical protein n=1 Tax=Pantoea eucrina TaxID=472693 RepID=UPI0024B7AD1E|nr:hypothetical protein [Pantoea eucrina]MDJ0023620.1 hypothetical protein [Pantoea eucrina]